MIRSLVLVPLVLCILTFALALAADAPKSADPAKAGAANADAAKVIQDNVVVDDRTEQVIRGGLKYLASAQAPTGSWSNGEHQAAITGYVLMAFMAAGELPGEGEYGKSVARGTDFLLSCVRQDGDSEGYVAARSGGHNMYGHGIATIALAELYGQTKDPKIRPSLEKAVKLIVSCQSEQGGWRYTPHRADADISVTVLQCVALRAAKNDGVDVPQVTLDRAVGYVKRCQHPDSGGFSYQPGSAPGFARTAAAIYSLQVCGLYDDPDVKRGSDYLVKAREDDRAWFTYGNFYAAPAEYMIGGKTWADWYAWIRERLIAKVQSQPGGVYYWRPLEGDKYPNSPVYATAVYTMVLAMPYHYIPLYQR